MVSRITARHLARAAYVYVRQASLAQVAQHQESTARQYALRERALELGWTDNQIVVIDEDQGKSGASAEQREGFKRLISDVALGEVGAVLGLEVSRLARSCADWYRLLELAAVAGTLILDSDGVYDPNHYNDRLLLGLKGTMSEAELHFLQQRMVGGRRNKARRGAFRLRLPIGYVWEDGGIHKDPDERVASALELFFSCFTRLGSATAVAKYFSDGSLAFPRRDGWGTLTAAVTWGQLSVSRAVQLLHNPIYAGIYAYDRFNEHEADPEDPCAGGRIWIKDSHSAYLTVEEYERNVARLRNNRRFHGGVMRKGAPREGSNLLQGIVLCGRCGRHPSCVYPSPTERVYYCRDAATGRMCKSYPAVQVDRVATEAVFDALNVTELGLAVAALEKVNERSADLHQQWQKRIEGAQYEADRAARRYHQVEPENRLVARSLECEWNARLEEVEQIEGQYAAVRLRPPFHLTPEQRKRIQSLAQDLPRLWGEPTTTNRQRKEIIRILIEDVTLRKLEEPRVIEVAIRWKSGLVTRHHAERERRNPQTTKPETNRRIMELFPTLPDAEIAEILDSEGHRTGTGLPFTAKRVASQRMRQGLCRSSPRSEDKRPTVQQAGES